MSITGPLIIVLARFFLLLLPREPAFILAGLIGIVWLVCAFSWVRRQIDEMTNR